MELIKINGKEHVIKYNINVLVQMEKYVGTSIASIFSTEDGISLETLRTLVYFGLKEMNHSLTHEAAGNIISEAIENGLSFTEITSTFVSEMNKALGFGAHRKDDGASDEKN